MSLANRQERERAKQGLQCPECWSFRTVADTEKFYCIVCGEQWDKHYFGEDEREGWSVMVKYVWVVMYVNSVGNQQVGSVHSSEQGAINAANDEKYKDKHAWHDGPFEEKD